MLEVEAISKSYAGRIAVHALSFTLKPGEILGLLGPNGAGKTTTISMVSGITDPDRGRVAWRGRNLHDPSGDGKRHLGVVPQEIALYDGLSAFDNAMTFGALYGLSREVLTQRVTDALRLVGLDDRAKDKPSTFSGGMKRRLNLACALVHDPDVLLLDEPTVGVDPQSRNAIFENLEILRSRGKAIVYTTHYMEEAERLADRIVIVDGGKVIADDTLAGLYRQLPASADLVIDIDGVADLGALAQLPGVKSAKQDKEQLTVAMESLDVSATVLAWLTSRGHPIRHLSSGRASLESLFLSLTGRALRDE